MAEQLVLSPLLTAEQVAELLGVCCETVYRAARAGEIVAVRVRRNIRFRSADVEQYLSRAAYANDADADVAIAAARSSAAPRAPGPSSPAAPAPAWVRPIKVRTKKAG